jgi:hypothetical protein
MLEDDPNVVGREAPSIAAEEFCTKPVPLIVTVVLLAPTITDGGRSPEMDGTGLLGGGVTVTVAEPDLALSWVDVAVMEVEPEAGTVAGAVYSPELEIVPDPAVQLTPEL